MKFNLKNETLAGITSSFALVPEAIAFAIIIGVSPMIGLTTAFILCIITAILGGRPAMISGAAGATAVILVDLVSKHGPEYLFAAVILMGVIQFLIGVFKLGKFVRLVPRAAMMGFLNGLAIVIFSAQFLHFKKDGQFISGNTLYIMLGLVALTMTIIQFLPKLTKAIPAPLVAILTVTGLSVAFGLDTKTISDIAKIEKGLPSFGFPTVPFTFETLKIVFPYALVMAIVGLMESLLTLSVIDEMTETKGHANKETRAQGIANIVCGMFGGQGGCAMIGQSIVNVESGGRTRLSGIIAALSLLVFLSIGASFIGMVPMAALVGLMFMVAIHMFQWSSFKMWKKVPTNDIIVMLIVTLITVIFHNLALAIVLGVVFAALSYAWQNATRIKVLRYDIAGTNEIGYNISGPLFFGSATTFEEAFTPKEDSNSIYVNFSGSRVVDHSGLDALSKVLKKYSDLGKKVHVFGLTPDCKDLIKNASPLMDLHFEKHLLD